MPPNSGLEQIPTGPDNLRVVSLDLNTVELEWDAGDWGDREPDEYELSYEGSRPHYRRHSGTETGISSSHHRFQSGRYGFTYCFKVRARFGDDWSDWSSELCDVEVPSFSGATSGRITRLRVHREIGYGPPDDHIRVNAVFELDTEPDMSFGFPVPFHVDDSGRIDEAWLEILRAAFVKNQGVDITHESTRRFNEVVSRVSPVFPPRPIRSLAPPHREGRVIHLQWIHSRMTPGANAGYSYEIDYKGTRGGHRNDEGTRTGIEVSEYDFEGQPGYTYCFRVRARNISGVSEWSDEVCAEQIPSEPVEETVSVQGSLEPDIPHEGNVIYAHHFRPSGRDVRVLSIHVFGSDLDQWGAHFLPPDSSRSDCADQSVGAVVWPGSALEGSDMERVFGSREPETPLLIAACKVGSGAGSGRVAPISVEVTYRRTVG